MLEDFIQHKTLHKEQARLLIYQFAEGGYSCSQQAAILTAIALRTPTLEELLGFRDALLELCIPVHIDREGCIDVCGTGGDGKNTFNISTTASFIVAGAGIPVCKHGNYGVSSFCGSSQVMEALGVSFFKDTRDLNRSMDRCGYVFLHAPLFHPALKNVALVRKELGFRTFFNIMGPLVNPANPDFQLTGVYSLALGRLYQYLLSKDRSRYTIIHSFDGYDELSLTSGARIWTKNSINNLEPKDFGMPAIAPVEIKGAASISLAAQNILDILKGNASQSMLNVSIANAALAIKTAKPELSFDDACAAARESLHSGKAYHVLTELQKVSIQTKKMYSHV